MIFKVKSINLNSILFPIFRIFELEEARYFFGGIWCNFGEGKKILCFYESKILN
jgi:hypothetical protein